MEDIARTMNLSKGTIYLYFKSKEDLFYAICEYKLEELKRQLSMLFKKKEDLISDAEVFYDNYRRAESGSESVFFEMIAESTRNPKIKSTGKRYMTWSYSHWSLMFSAVFLIME